MGKESHEEFVERLDEEDVRRGVEGKLPNPWNPRRVRAGKALLIKKDREREAERKRALRCEPSVEGVTPAPVVEPTKAPDAMKSHLDPDAIRPADDRKSLADLENERELRRIREAKREKEEIRDEREQVRGEREELRRERGFLRRATIGLILIALIGVISQLWKCTNELNPRSLKSEAVEHSTLHLNPIRLRPAVRLALIAMGASRARSDSGEPLGSRYSEI